MVQEVAEFLRRTLAVALEDGVAEFVHFFLRQRTDGFEGLGGVPGALLPEGVHDIQQAAERRDLFFPGVHIIRLVRCKYTKNLRIFA